MNDSTRLIKQLILDFETRKISADFALTEINKLSNQHVDIDWLSSYNGSMDLDSFVRILTISEIDDWQNITDDIATSLIVEILDNIEDEALIHRNSEALEKRYSKPTGRLSNWIFYENITEPIEILRLLKKNTSIAL